MNEEYILRKKKRNNYEEDERKKRGFFFILGERLKNGRLLLLLLAFLFTLIGLSASTYAWFTSNFTVSVQEIDVTVSSGSGIQISTNAKDWKSLITVSDITNHTGYAAAVNQIPTSTTQISPVSTVAEAYANATTKTQGLHMYRGNIVNDVTDGTMYLDTYSETDGSGTPNYVAFDLFLKLDFSTAKQVYLTPNTGIIANATNTYIQYAGRMGFVVNGHDESSATETELQDIKGATNVLIYEPNYDVHTETGLANGRNNYGITDRSANGNATPCPYYGVKAAFTYDSTNPTTNPGTGLGSTDSSKFALVEPDIVTTAANSERTAFLTLQPGVTKIRVYMWIEGQDIDCENNASGGDVKFNLGFTVDNE